MNGALAVANQEPASTKISYIDLVRQFAQEEQELIEIFRTSMRGGQWVGGEAIEELERALCIRFHSPQTVTVGSGTDALILGMRALGIGPGDEVITPPNSFVSSTSSIIAVGATPVFVDVEPNQLMDLDKIPALIGPRTKAIMPVHLSGRCLDMDTLLDLAQSRGLSVIEDAAQAIGAKWAGRYAGTMGDVGCFSTHPLKNLNAMGDGGFVFCKRQETADAIRRLRNNGQSDRNTVVQWGTVSRMDPLQAKILSHRLRGLDELERTRRHNASIYREHLDPAHVQFSRCRPEQYTVFHTFVVQVDRRDELQAYLADLGIGSSIHYPTPIHLQPAAQSLGHSPGDFPVAEAQAKRILSLPIHQFITPNQIRLICERINRFFS